MKTLLHDILNPPPGEKQILFAVNLQPPIDTRHKNIEIARVYTSIVTDLRYQLSKMNSKEHRTYLLSGNEVTNNYEDQVLFEFTCIMCEVRLSVKHYSYYLELETDTDIKKIIGGYHFRKMLRTVYRNTSYECTNYDIEDCIAIETNMSDHYNYFKNRLKCAALENSIIIVEDAMSNC